MENDFEEANVPNEGWNQARKHEISSLSALNTTQEMVYTKTVGN